MAKTTEHEPRTANRLSRFMSCAAIAGMMVIANSAPAFAQSERRSGTTSPNYCGTALVEELARRIGGRVAVVAGNGSTEFAAPEIGTADTISVRCGHDPEVYGIFDGRHDWAPAFLNAFLAVAERTMGRPQNELAGSMAQCRRLAFRPFNRETGFGFSKQEKSGSAEVKTRSYVLTCGFEGDPVYSRYGFKPPSPRN